MNPAKCLCLVVMIGLFAAVPTQVTADSGSADAEQTLGPHKKAAEARALRYFRYEFRAGSDSIVVTLLHIETEQPEPVEGWPGRYRTQGQAFLEFFDSRGGSFSRTTAPFEVLTEQKPGQELKVIDFSRK